MWNASTNDPVLDYHDQFVTYVNTSVPIFKTKATFIVNVIVCVLNAFFALCSTTGNAFIITAILKTSSLHSPANSLLGCLTLCDFFLGFLSGPSLVALKTVELLGHLKTHCVLRTILDSSSFISLNTSLWCLVIMTVDRYLSLYLHLRYAAVVTINRVLIAVAVACFVSIAISVLQFWSSKRAFFLSAKLSSTVCVLIMTIVYFRILLLIRRHQRQIRNLRIVDSSTTSCRNSLNLAVYKKYAYTVGFIMLLIVACYVPTTVISFCTEFNCIENREHEEIVYSLMMTFVMLTGTLHPVVIMWRTEAIRQAAKRIFRHIIPIN